MAKIYAPNQGYTGTSAGVPFVKGTAETDDPLRIAWFASHGYLVEDSRLEKDGQQGPDTEKLANARMKKGKPVR